MTTIQHSITALAQLNQTLDEAFAQGWQAHPIKGTHQYRGCSVQWGPQRHGSIYLNHPHWHPEVGQETPEIRLQIAPWVMQQIHEVATPPRVRRWKVTYSHCPMFFCYTIAARSMTEAVDIASEQACVPGSEFTVTELVDEEYK